MVEELWWLVKGRWCEGTLRGGEVLYNIVRTGMYSVCTGIYGSCKCFCVLYVLVCTGTYITPYIGNQYKSTWWGTTSVLRLLFPSSRTHHLVQPINLLLYVFSSTLAHVCFLYCRACPTSFACSFHSILMARPGTRNRRFFDGGLVQDLVAIFGWLRRKPAATAKTAGRN